MLFCDDNKLTSKDLYFEYLSGGISRSRDQILTLSELEHLYIEKVLQIERGRVEEAAKRLALSRSALYEKIKKHNIELSGIPKCVLNSERSIFPVQEAGIYDFSNP